MSLRFMTKNNIKASVIYLDEQAERSVSEGILSPNRHFSSLGRAGITALASLQPVHISSTPLHGLLPYRFGGPVSRSIRDDIDQTIEKGVK